MQKQVLALGPTATFYLVWWARNEVVWNLVVWRPEKLFKLLQQCIVLMISTTLPRKLYSKDANWWESEKTKIV